MYFTNIYKGIYVYHVLIYFFRQILLYRDVHNFDFQNKNRGFKCKSWFQF